MIKEVEGLFSLTEALALYSIIDKEVAAINALSKLAFDSFLSQRHFE